jgi:hypothetical protein
VPSQIKSSGRNFCCKFSLVFCFHYWLALFWNVCSPVKWLYDCLYISIPCTLALFSHTCLLCAGHSASYHFDIGTHVYDGNWYSLEVWSSPGILIHFNGKVQEAWRTDVCWSALWVLLVSCSKVPCVFYRATCDQQCAQFLV